MKLYRWNDRPVEPLGGGVTRRLLTVQNLMLAEIFVPAGVAFPEHRLQSEQLTIFQRGRAEYSAGGQTLTATAGDIVHIGPGVTHADRVLEDTVVLDIFAPPRPDWLKA